MNTAEMRRQLSIEALERREKLSQEIVNYKKYGMSEDYIAEKLNIKKVDVRRLYSMHCVSEKYRTRPNSRIILTIMDNNRKETAKVLGITVKQLKYKLLKDNFSMGDIMKVLLVYYNFLDCCESTTDFNSLMVNIRTVYEEAEEAKKYNEH